MLGYTRRDLLVFLAAIACVVTITSLLLMYFIPARRHGFQSPPAGATRSMRASATSIGKYWRVRMWICICD